MHALAAPPKTISAPDPAHPRALHDFAHHHNRPRMQPLAALPKTISAPALSRKIRSYNPKCPFPFALLLHFSTLNFLAAPPRPPPTAHGPLPTAYCLLPTAYCLLPTASKFMPIATKCNGMQRLPKTASTPTPPKPAFPYVPSCLRAFRNEMQRRLTSMQCAWPERPREKPPAESPRPIQQFVSRATGPSTVPELPAAMHGP